MPPRKKNYYYTRNRVAETEELPWVRISGLTKLELPRPVVLINGAFDILHSGHCRVIFEARDQAGEGTLVCGLDSDARVKTKGVERPILSFIERATALGYMPIDYLVEIDSDVEMTRLVYALKPDLRLQGMDYKGKESKYPGVKKIFIRDSSMHTSEIIRRILEKYKGQYERIDKE